ncbi:MAG: quinohemoprotein amine dehydrogenase subunit gamma [Acidobacteriota bacterium]|nr:quinohemoprotein amine dehydrogenase subunit gamma [Acidobacteriota bacterium]
MKHLQPINRKAERIETLVEDNDIVALQDDGANIPLGCSFVFQPGWEADSKGGTAGLCQPVERDLFDCYITCFWPAHVPDLYNHAPDWTSKCGSAAKDWRKIDLIFP